MFEGIVHLAIETGNPMELTNKKKEYLEDNIEKIAVERNLSLKQIQSLSAKYGKQQRRGRITSGTTMLIKSHTSKPTLK